MICEICKHNPCDYLCPNYIPPKVDHYCSVCGDGILDGEEYITNDDGKYIHYDCIRGIRWLSEWLGHEIRVMEVQN